MATKYLIPGATFNGDGTTSSAAASDGAAGAWNSLADIVDGTPTYGTLTYGDTVYVATYDSGANTSESTSGNMTFSSSFGGGLTPTRLIMDDGTIFGTGGTFTLSTGTSSHQITTNGWTIIGNGRFTLSTTRAFDFNILNTYGYISGLKVDSANCLAVINGAVSRATIFEDLTIAIRGFENKDSVFLAPAFGGTFFIKNLLIDFTGATMTNSNRKHLFDCDNSEGNYFYVSGCRIIGNGIDPIQLFDVNGIATASRNGITAIIDGLEHNSSIAEANIAPTLVEHNDCIRKIDIRVIGGESPFDNLFSWAHGYVIWQQGKSYPTYNAELPDGTKWSYKFFPQYVLDERPLICPPLRKTWNSTAATVTITLEMLFDDRQTPDDFDVWIEIQYINNTGSTMEYETTRVAYDATPSTLTTSTASWSLTSYGPISLSKYKISKTTANSVKQYTEIVVRPYVALRPVDANSFGFYDPDVSLA